MNSQENDEESKGEVVYMIGKGSSELRVTSGERMGGTGQCLDVGASGLLELDG